MTSAIADILADPSRTGPLVSVLTRARELGFLGPVAIQDHLVNGADFAAAMLRQTPDSAPGGVAATALRARAKLRDPAAPLDVVDLGSGGGVPALVLAVVCSGAHLTLVERGERRCDFLREAIETLELSGRAVVVEGEAESSSRDPSLSGRFDVVTARSFGPPAVTAESGVRFLRMGGHLVVSDPPGQRTGRWPQEGLALLGLCLAAGYDGVRTSLSRAQRCGDLDDRYPRRAATVRKRPLF